MNSRVTEPTMMMTPPKELLKPKRPWKPFQFTRLEPVSKQQAALAQRVEWLLPGVRLAAQVREEVRARLAELLEEDVALSIDELRVVPASQLRKNMREPNFMAVVAPQPQKARGFIEVELALAHLIVDKLLGGAGDAVAMRPLTDIEEGVLLYVLLEVMRTLAPHVDPSLPRLRLESVVRSLDEALQLAADEEQMVVVQLHGRVSGQPGALRLFLPGSLVAAANPPADAAIRRTRRLAQARAQAKRLKTVKTWLRAEIAQVEISAGDLAALRERDVVVVETLSCRVDRGENGTVLLKVGRGRAGHADAEVTFEGGRYQAKVTGFSLGDEVRPGAAEPMDGQAPEGDRRSNVTDSSQGQEGVELLNDVPLQIAVELARVSVTAEDVLELKVGQVIDLNRGAGEPMDLSVNGKVVARGELVEIEGNLGVRILSLVG